MLCESCKVEMVERLATRKAPYHYELVALPHVWLSGIRVYQCAECGEEIPVIPHVQELHRVISGIIVRKSGLLSGAEIRYLRRQAGFSAKEFSTLIATDPSTLSRVESGKQKLSPARDRLARAVSVAASDGGEAREVLLNYAEEKTAPRKASVKKSRIHSNQLDLFNLHNDKWEPVKKAA